MRCVMRWKISTKEMLSVSINNILVTDSLESLILSGFCFYCAIKKGNKQDEVKDKWIDVGSFECSKEQRKIKIKQ